MHSIAPSRPETTGARRELSFIGDIVTHTANGVTVSLQWVSAHTYSVTTYDGPNRIGELTRSFGTEAEARSAARTIAVQLKAGRSVAQIIEATRALSAPAQPARNPLDELAQHGVRRQVHPNLNTPGVDLPDAQFHALDVSIRNGRVYRGGKPGQATVVVMNALAKRGYLELTAKPGSRGWNWRYGEHLPAGYIAWQREKARRESMAVAA